MSDSSDEVDELVKYASELLSKRNDSMSTSSKTNSPKQKKKKNSLSKKTSQTANTSNSIKNPLTMSPAFELHTKKTIIPKQKTEPRKFTVEQTNSIDLITNINSKKPSHPIFDLSTSNDPFSFDLPPKSNLKKTNDTQQKPLKCGIDKPQQSVVSIRPSTEFPNKQPTNVISYDLTISPVDKQNKKLPNSTTEINMSLGFDENNSDQFQIQSNKKIIQKDYSTSDSSQDNKKKRIIFNIDSESNKENNEREEEDFIDFDLSKLKLPNKKKNDSEKQTRDNTHKRFGQNLQNSLSLSKRESVSHHEDEDVNDSNQDIEADFNFAIPKKTDSTIMKNPILNHSYNQDLNIEEEEEENYEPRIDSKNKSYSIKTNNANPILSNNEEEDDELAIETILTKLKNINKVSTKYQNSTNSIIDRENNNEEEEEFIEEKTKKKYNKRDDEIESSENSNEHANSNEYNSDFDKEYSNQNKGDFAKKSANNHTIKQVTYQNKQKLKIFQEEEEEEEETYGKVKNNQTNRKEKEESILDKVKSLINNDYDEIEEEEFDDDYKTSTLNQAKNIIQGDKNEMNILDFEDEEINEDEEAKIQKIIKSYSSINESSSSHEEIIPEEEEEATEIRDQNISSKISTLKIAVENDSSENSVMESKSKQMPAFDIPLLDEIMSNPRKTSHTKKGKKENVDSDSSLDSDEEKIVQSYLSSDDEEAKPPPTSQKHENRQIRKSDKLSHEKESKKKEKPKDSSNKNYSNDENDSDSKDDELVKKILSSSHIIDSSESPPELLSSDSDSDSDSSESYVDKLKKLFPNLDLD
ncbi:hypothetical protein TRFO_30867 [Tritrichomonas foetus]|uniref:Uncharacterized protein n=1 Tax=Tritrichomonas foetus TaxID=1144522 RepID=A0A1J4JUL0_9EUKA|nr:hypothetical protein TRFO_30867 [Tritrichomonas foetus]|eukprot:OHT02160.1 hypothetical protein TRFO_30867 [Tritrichomonas foetus]